MAESGLAVWQVILLGCAGGALPDLIRIFKNLRDPKVAADLKTWQCWATIAFLVALGGFVTWLLQVTGRVEAVASGYAAPELVTRLAQERAPDLSGLLPAGGGQGGEDHLESLLSTIRAAKPEVAVALTGGGKPGFNPRTWWAM